MATKEQLEWGSCYKKENNSNSNYCDEHYKKAYPCAPGVSYYGRGALPIYWYLPFQLCTFLDPLNTNRLSSLFSQVINLGKLFKSRLKQ